MSVFLLSSSEAHPAFCSIGTGVLSQGGGVIAVRPNLIRVSGATPPLLLFAFLARTGTALYFGPTNCLLSDLGGRAV